jgi:Zn finger protein HypA/HybF involved in hydrogenase expression
MSSNWELLYSDYAIIIRKESIINKGKYFIEEIGLKCPQCKTILPVLTHSKSMRCKNCNLHMQRYANGLFCST